jgi:hypothetical protein
MTAICWGFALASRLIKQNILTDHTALQALQADHPPQFPWKLRGIFPTALASRVCYVL